MRKHFGTDGVRGIANETLTPELAFKLGKYGGYLLTKENEKPKVVVGLDTRISSKMLESALSAGLMSVGIEVIQLGVIPTPGVAYMTRKLGADAGVMISASHNPFEDNGIKFFAGDGYKLPDETEFEIERLMEEETEIKRPTGKFVGTVTDYREGVASYIQMLKKTITHPFNGLKIVIDCANGAASSVATRTFADLGAEVITTHSNPNGININVECGSTHPKALQRKVLEEKADIGLAFDGDADRLIAVDELGNIVDGDTVMYICAKNMKEKEKLKNDTVVGTVMSNLGLKKALEKEGIHFIETSVGDRYVIEEMKKGDFVFGGEQSGHVIFHEHNTTGDGILTALQLTQVLVESENTLSKLAESLKIYPQLLVNVKVKDKKAWESSEKVQSAIQKEKENLGERGRILIRASGTENIVRVMAEGENTEEIHDIVARLAKLIEEGK